MRADDSAIVKKSETEVRKTTSATTTHVLEAREGKTRCCVLTAVDTTEVSTKKFEIRTASLGVRVHWSQDSRCSDAHA